MPFVSGASHAGVARLGPLTFYAEVWTIGKVALGLAPVITGLLIMKVSRARSGGRPDNAGTGFAESG
jgi:hypothetical protein